MNKKKIYKFIFINLLIILFIFVCKIENIPSKIIVYDGEEVDIGNFLRNIIKNK